MTQSLGAKRIYNYKEIKKERIHKESVKKRRRQGEEQWHLGIASCSPGKRRGARVLLEVEEDEQKMMAGWTAGEWRRWLELGTGLGLYWALKLEMSSDRRPVYVKPD